MRLLEGTEVLFIGLVCLVCLVYLVEPDEPDLLCALRRYRSLARIRPHIWLNLVHDSRIRHSLFTCVGGDRAGCCQAGSYYNGFCGGRSKLAAADRHRDGLRDLVRRGGCGGNAGDLCQGWVAWGRCRSVWREFVLDSGRIVLCTTAVSTEPSYRRRLLPAPVQSNGRSALHALCRGIVSGVGRGSVQSIGFGVQRRDRRGGEPATRNGSRCGHRVDIYDLRRHVFRGHSRFCPTQRHHGWAAVYCFCREWADGRGRCGGGPCGAGGEIGFLSTGESQRLDSLHRRRYHHDAGIDSPARCVSTHHLGEERANGGAWFNPWRRDLFPVLLRTDVPHLFGHAYRSGKVWTAARGRFATGVADTHPPTYADRRADPVFRSGTFGRHELFERDIARSLGDPE